MACIDRAVMHEDRMKMISVAGVTWLLTKAPKQWCIIIILCTIFLLRENRFKIKDFTEFEFLVVLYCLKLLIIEVESIERYL